MNSTAQQRTYWMAAVIGLVTIVIGLFATGRGKAATKSAPPALPEVSVIHVHGEDVATYRDYPARTYARDLVEVRGRVDGYVDRRTFDIGSDVRAGQVLYVLDVRPYEAEVERARGALAQATADIAQAEASLLKARQDVDRLRPVGQGGARGESHESEKERQWARAVGTGRSRAEAGPRQCVCRASGRRGGRRRPQG